MMVSMQSRAGKNARTLVIARALATFVLVLSVAAAAVFLADRSGLHATDAGFRVAVGLAALLSVAFLVRRRDR